MWIFWFIVLCGKKWILSPISSIINYSENYLEQQYNVQRNHWGESQKVPKINWEIEYLQEMNQNFCKSKFFCHLIILLCKFSTVLVVCWARYFTIWISKQPHLSDYVCHLFVMIFMNFIKINNVKNHYDLRKGIKVTVHLRKLLKVDYFRAIFFLRPILRAMP